MNFQSDHREFQTADQGQGSAALDLEQALICHCLFTPENLGDVAARCVPEDFGHPVHQKIIAHLLQLHREGRKPSAQAIKVMFGDEEIAPNLTAAAYTQGILKSLPQHVMTPFADVLETFLDQTFRDRLAQIGTNLQFASAGSLLVSDIASDAVHAIDDVLSATRQGQVQTYNAQGAAQAVLKSLDEGGETLPTSGLVDLDRLIGGWPKGQLTIVAGRPGMGKSMFATSAIRRSAKKGFCTAFFSLEMTRRQIGARLLTDESYIASEPLKYADILKSKSLDHRSRDRLNRASDELEHLPITFEEQRNLTVSEIAARSRKLANELARAGQQLELVVVDHIGLVRPSNRYSGNRHREISETTNALATLAKDLDCAVIGLCQLNRAVEGRDNKRPTMADLRDSGSIEEDASLILFLYRAAYYLEREGPHDDQEKEFQRQSLIEGLRNTIEISVSKNRNGETGQIKAFVDMGANALRNSDFNRGTAQ